MGAPQEIRIRWRPQPRQLKFLRACGLSHPFDGGKPGKPVAKIIGFGGAAGGGKSDSMMAAAIIYALTYKGARIGYFRRTFAQLNGAGGAIARSRELISQFAKYNASEGVWTFPNGSILKFCYLAKDADLENYQSQQFEVICFDEATHFPWHHIAYMQSRIRSVKGYPTFTCMGTNPGGIGHGWFKRLFVKSGEPEQPRVVEIEPGKRFRIMFIPAKLSDNAILEAADPDYRKNLEMQPEHIRRQLLEGDWDTAEGMAFDEWRDYIHICSPFAVPDEWIRFTSLDWGYAKPYSVGWYAVDHDGRLWKYRELYGYGGSEDKGSKEDPADVAAKMKELEKRPDGTMERIRYRSADDAIFSQGQDSSPSVAEQFAREGIHWQRVGKGPRSRVSGKLEMHHRLKWERDADGNWTGELPMLVIFNTCRHTNRTIPQLILDVNDPEDVDTDMEDHAYDETRYACMSRPMKPVRPKEELSKQQQHKKRLAKSRVNPVRTIG